MGRRSGIGTAVAAASLALAACARPSWTDPARSRDQRELAAAPAVAVPASPDPAPSPPPWAAGLIGRPLRALFPRTGVCVGHPDGIVRRFEGRPAGVALAGWGWDAQARAPVARVLLADASLIIVGAGDGGLAHERPPGPALGPGEARTGWRAEAPAARGALRAYGLTQNGRAVCPLGQVQLG